MAKKTLSVSMLAIAALLAWAPGAAACPGAKVPAAGESPDQARLAMFCVINHVRHRHGLHPLGGDLSLVFAAQEHSDTMNAENFFAHDGDGTPASRTASAGYRGKSVGETLAFGYGAAGGPKAMVRAWMHSPEHRGILLMRRWRQVGIGVGFGSPLGADAPGEATYTADFGHRTG
jgi:uncharacterized protein YkwD